MHALQVIVYPEVLSHCGHGHDLTSAPQLSVINIADIIEVLSIKHWRQRAFAETPPTERLSREVLVS